MARKGCFSVMKYVAVVFNLIFWLVGIGVLAVSIWLYIDGSLYMKNLDGSLYLKNIDDGYMYYTVIYTLMAAGAVMFFIGLLGCCGALQESPCMLVTFLIFVLVIFTAEVTGGVWTWMHQDEIIDAEFMKMVKYEYGNSDSVNKMVDVIQQDLHCCGAEHPGDWAQSVWNSNDKSAVEVGISISCYSLSTSKDKDPVDAERGCYLVPETCCSIKRPEECEVNRKIKFSGFSFEGLYSEGCIPKLQHYFKEHMMPIYQMGIGIGAVQVLGLIFSFVFCLAIRAEDSTLDV